MNTYITPLEYMHSTSAQETGSLIGNLCRLSSGVAIGATSLPVTPALIQGLSTNDVVTVFDGANSEQVIVASPTSVGSSSIPVSATTYAHAALVVVATDGVLGSLAQEIIDASAWVENICQQSLWQASYASETLRIPSMRASIDNQQMLTFRPRHFPITVVSGLTIRSAQPISTGYDASQAIIDGGAQMVTVPWLIGSGVGAGTYNLYAPVSRKAQLWLTLSYTAGYAPGALPGDVRDAAILLVSEQLSRRQNPTGSAEIQLGRKHLVNSLRGDQSGKSLFVKQAEFKLQNYSQEAY